MYFLGINIKNRYKQTNTGRNMKQFTTQYFFVPTTKFEIIFQKIISNVQYLFI